ncbi:MAG: hypothetical protein KAS64_02670 [Spirochaetes bacterium]|nr:hypothetical protein [Spirochaetota bacterium]
MFNRKNKYKLLKKEIEELKEKNYDLDRIIQMYEKYSKLSTKEIIDASDTISAHEEVSNFSRSEMKNLVETVSALENNNEFSRQELLSAKSNISDKAFVIEKALKDLIEAGRTIKAHEEVEKLSREELKEAKSKLSELKKRVEYMEKKQSGEKNV